jgi:hypothetical protein
MNLTNMSRVREYIANLPEEACHMHYWDCGTVCCIGGACERIMWKEDRVKLDRNRKYASYEVETIARWLGLPEHEAYRLFHFYDAEDPDEGWKAWMLERIDSLIASKTPTLPFKPYATTLKQFIEATDPA